MVFDLGQFKGVGVCKTLRPSASHLKKNTIAIGTGLDSKQVGRINMLNVGAEIFYDVSTEMQVKRDSLHASAVRAGLTFGHEFILGKFLFSQRIGVYVFDQTPYYAQKRPGLIYHSCFPGYCHQRV